MPRQNLQYLHNFGGVRNASLMHIAHANGFPPATYSPLAMMFISDHHVVGLAARPLWPGHSPQEFKNWHVLAHDLIEGLETLGMAGVVGVGHSMGGITTLLAAVRRPHLFRALVLLDPVLLPPRWLAFVRWMRRLRLPWHPPLVKGALRRRRIWPSREAAYAYFKGKPLFASWLDAALRAYVESGTRPTAEGQVELIYPPEWEARIFDVVPADEWQFVPRLSPSLPVLFVRGEHSTTFRPDVQARVARLLPHARVAVVPHAGHMFPLERPTETAALIQAFLS